MPVRLEIVAVGDCDAVRRDFNRRAPLVAGLLTVHKYGSAAGFVANRLAGRLPFRARRHSLFVFFQLSHFVIGSVLCCSARPVRSKIAKGSLSAMDGFGLLSPREAALCAIPSPSRH